MMNDVCNTNQLLKKNLDSQPCIERFRNNAWVELSRTEKINTLQEMECLMAKLYGRKPKFVRLASINSYPMLQNVANGMFYNPGYYDVGKFITNGYVCLISAVHEGRHAYQDDIIQESITSHPLDVAKAPIWKMNFFGNGCYYLPNLESDYRNALYKCQPIEADAYNYEIDVMKALEFYFCDDHEYYNCLNNLVEMRKIYAEMAIHYFGDNYTEEIERVIERNYNYKKKLK